ncbi:hypothetical protein [Streptomyces sp. HPF1205]|uniref:hypothetical protein n=1 Tax=Streptomyces sp. HPF1205 TaxID=2873262 RepID=UPI001CED7BD3|nr:hypothetical protein [Streptomyces sp. HPF1205]
MSGSEKPPRRQVSQRANVRSQGRNIMAGRDVRTTEINNYLGPNSGPGRGVGRKGLALFFAGVLVLGAVGFQVLRWEGGRHTADTADTARTRPTAPASAYSPDGPNSADSSTAPAGGATTPAGRVTTTPAASAGPPFVARSSFPGSALDPIAAGSQWAFVLDHPLTPSQLAGLERLDGLDGQAVWDYLRPLGARIASDNWATGPRMTFKMLFLSDRSTSLSIQSMRPVHIACTQSTAVTVVDFASEGDDAVPTVAFSLLKPDVPLAEVNSAGEPTGPYFSGHQIDLGAGITPGALDVQATGAPGKSCSWRFRVGFATASSQSTQLVDDGGEPFTIEAAPLHPAQHIQYGLDTTGRKRWADCATAADCN